MLELIVPQHAVLGQNVSLECNFNLDGEKLYSVKWYKDGNEFYRYVPQEKPPVLVFLQPGVSAVVHESTQRMVVLRSVNLMSTGRYRCEVSAEAPSFQTVSDHSDMTVIALPEDEPVITARPGKHRYQVGDVVRFNCTSTRSKPHATLSWFINGDPCHGGTVRQCLTNTCCIHLEDRSSSNNEKTKNERRGVKRVSKRERRRKKDQHGKKRRKMKGEKRDVAKMGERERERAEEKRRFMLLSSQRAKLKSAITAAIRSATVMKSIM
ncbi:hypothetical protein ALC60_13121 [Trachymyrmex zeteki]|uniref:Ig-like domain-containing protein n=1 Tax=Mycetomoellerius zeteki TaxID=64791 RepID=A0A151WJI4_9HYME|nr:hypothetical protein ALC60_13121 [Trachymyrmex zeteki]